MNIFYVDRDPIVASQMLCDRHVVKMALETAQILSTVLGGPYKPTHKNHPSVLWAAKHTEWTYEHFQGLLKEYTHRYGKTHACERLNFALDFTKDEPWEDPPQCMPDQFKDDNTVEAYRSYYRGGKAHIAKWNKTRNPPAWWT